MKCEEQGQKPEMRKNMMPGVTERSNDAGTSIGGAGVGYAEKAGRTPCVIERSNVADTCIGRASKGLVDVTWRKQAVYTLLIADNVMIPR